MNPRWLVTEPHRPTTPDPPPRPAPGRGAEHREDLLYVLASKRWSFPFHLQLHSCDAKSLANSLARSGRRSCILPGPGPPQHSRTAPTARLDPGAPS